MNLLSQCRKIICVGRNFAAHAKELGNAVPSSKPILFLKPPSSLTVAPSPLLIPNSCDDLHHEIELGVVIGEGGSNIAVDKVRRHVAGYVLALDMTARSIQNEDKKLGLPWLYAKGQDGMCPISSFHSVSSVPSLNPENIELWCEVDGEPRQRGQTKNMIFPVYWLISYISHHFTLTPGDLILTGTPEGVGPVRHGQVIRGGITGFPQFDISFNAVKRATPPPLPPSRLEYEAAQAKFSKL